MPDRVKDTRMGAGYTQSGAIRLATVTIPCNCMCTWIVTVPGPGLNCMSELRYRNTICPCRHTEVH